jgi:hypothetical protein
MARRLRSLLSGLVSHRYLVILTVYALAATYGDHHGGDMEAVGDGARRLFQTGPHDGLHLYSDDPSMQMGPLTFVLVRLLQLLSADHVFLAFVVVSAGLLLLAVRFVENCVTEAEDDEKQRVRLAVLSGGVVVAYFWAVAVPGWSHIDDLCALTCLAFAVQATRRTQGRWSGWVAGAALGAAVGFKPWAVLAIAVVWLLPAARRRGGAVATGLVTCACWLPFLLAAPSTLGALRHFTILANAGSLPWGLGYAHAPEWERPAQLLLATVIIALAARRDRWDIALLAVAFSRLLLDAGTYPYYDVELVLGTLLVDVARAPGRRGLATAAAPLTLAAAALLGVASLTHQPDLVLASRILLLSAVMYGAVATRSLRDHGARRSNEPTLTACACPTTHARAASTL